MAFLLIMKNIKTDVYWYTKKKRIEFPSLRADISTDVVVVGGGIAGLSVADALSRAGKRVVVLEREFCGAGVSGKSSGMITQDSELELTDLISNLGVDRARRLWEFVGEGMEKIRGNIAAHKIDCEYKEDDYVFVANNRRGFEKAIREHRSREVLGYESYLYDRVSVKKIINSSRYYGAVRYPGTFSINSFLYTQAFCNVLSKRGVSIFEKTNVSLIGHEEVLTENGHHVRAEYVVVCVDKFLPHLRRFTKDVYHVETYLTLSEPLSDDDIARIFPSGNLMVNDSDIIYQYYRITSDRRLLLGGGDYLTTYAYTKSRRPERIIPKLSRYMAKKFPELTFNIEYVWPGLLGVSKDLIPIVGADRAMPYVYYISAATGLAWATGVGVYVAEKILNRRDEYDDLFSPYRRFPLDPLMRMFQPFITTPMTFGLSHAFVKYLRS